MLHGVTCALLPQQVLQDSIPRVVYALCIGTMRNLVKRTFLRDLNWGGLCGTKEPSILPLVTPMYTILQFKKHFYVGYTGATMLMYNFFFKLEAL